MNMETAQNFVPANTEVDSVKADADSVKADANTVKCNRITIFRFKFTAAVMGHITNFAKVHQYDSRENYKEAWQEWVEENDEIIFAEKKRLESLGYSGDVEEKMYKAGRYYFRNKQAGDEKDKKQRRKYIPTSRDLIEAMDSHITHGIVEDNFTPAEGFDNFCENYRRLLAEEITRTLQIVNLDTDEMSKKIKKTYKNRYFIVSRQQ